LSAGFCNSFYCPEAFTRHVWQTALDRMAAGDPTGTKLSEPSVPAVTSSQAAATSAMHVAAPGSGGGPSPAFAGTLVTSVAAVTDTAPAEACAHSQQG
jgi:hypothetical protein